MIGRRDGQTTSTSKQQQRMRRRLLERRGPDWAKLLTVRQARGKWMIPAYKGLLYTSLSASMYMMCRMVLVRSSGVIWRY